MPTTPKGIWYPSETNTVDLAGPDEVNPGDLGKLARTTDDAIPPPWNRVRLEAGADLFTLAPGVYDFNASVMSEIINAPEKYPSMVEVVGPVGGGGTIKTIRVWPYRRDYWYWTNSDSPYGDMRAWKREEPGGGGGQIIDAGAQHRVREEIAVRRKGGRIGTGGKAVVAIRFDHGLTNFKQYHLPELKRLGLPCTLAMNSGNWGIAENSGMTQSELSKAIAEAGIEVWNHSQTHEDASTYDNLYREIVTGAEELRSQIGNAFVDGWITPGVGDTNYGGFNAGQSAAGWATTAGQLILASHGFATGHMPGPYRPMSGIPMVGLNHRGIEAQTPATVKGWIDEAVAQGTALTLMSHPRVIGGSGMMTPEQYTEVWEYLASLRAAGTLLVLTVGGSLVADISSAYRYPIVAPMGVAANIAAGAETGRTGSIENRGWLRGAQVEIIADITMSASGTVNMRVSGQDTQQRPVSAGRQLVRRFASITATASDFTAWVSPSVSATVHQLTVTPA